MTQPLSEGDKVIIVASASAVKHDRLLAGVDVIKSWGLQVKVEEQVLTRSGYFAGDDTARLTALQNAINDREIKAIFCARGGYGTTRILDDLNIDHLHTQPKWIIGFSDITALHLKIASKGLSSVHGAMPVQYGEPEHSESIQKLRELLFGKDYSYEIESHKGNRQGMANGPLIGGNLALLADSIGTQSELNSSGRILFLEEIGEEMYRVDRMLNQLKRAGKFEGIKGLIVGHFTDINDPDGSFGFSVEQSIERVVNDDIPICFGFPAGHEAPNYPLFMNFLHEFEVTSSGVSVKMER